MKSIILFILLLCFPVSALYSQLKQETSMKGIVNTAALDNGEIKYYQYNKKKSALSIYNLDYSVWRTIKMQLPKNHDLDEIKLISTSIFNKDTLAEVLYTCSYNSISGYADDFIKTTYTLNLIDESGKVLLKEDDCTMFKFVNSKGTKKLFIYKNLDYQSNAQPETIIYALP